VRRLFAVLATLLVLVVVVQFFLAAGGAFDTAPNDESFRPHRALGYGTVLLAVLSTIVAAFARLPGRLIGMTALIAGLGVVQGLIRAIAAVFNDTGDTTTAAGRAVFGLHAINALVILAMAETVARQARTLARSRPTGGPAGATAFRPAAEPTQTAP
jgi:heme A synthase